MTLLNQIFKWTESDLKLWQRDAARRLFQQRVLSNEDYDELYILLKASHGLPNPQNLHPLPLTEKNLPANAIGAVPVTLKAMRNLRSVNKIAPDQILPFSPKGITVIYGDNGSGKSGYSRVLKRACRARDEFEKVLPDATNPNVEKNIPEAFFDIEVDGEAVDSIRWEEGLSPDELSTITVFDSHCARIYLTAEQDVVYLPYGLDVVENLASQVIPKLKTMLQEDLAKINIDIEPFKHLQNETHVGKCIKNLNAKTDPELIRKLANFTQEEIARISELDLALSEQDPKAKAQQIRLSVQRIKGLINRIDAALLWVNDEAVVKLQRLEGDTKAALQAEVLAAENFRSGEDLLPGTGEEIWKNLFESARKFSVNTAYVKHEFPHVSDALCLLCQQPIMENAGERIKRFEQFIQEDVAKIADEKGFVA